MAQKTIRIKKASYYDFIGARKKNAASSTTNIGEKLVFKSYQNFAT